MKPTFNLTFPITFVLSAAWLLGQPASALSQEALTPKQGDQLSHDLVPSTPSQDFFRQGQQQMEREAQYLYQRQHSSNEPILEDNVNPQAELDQLPQLEPSLRTLPTQEDQ